MDLNMNSNENDSANDLNTNESINNHIENLIQNEFNSANYDVNMNYTLNLNQLTQFINLNNQDCLMNSNDNTSILNSTANINDIESFEKEFETNLKAKQSIDNNNTNSNIENDSFSFSFLSDDVLSSGSVSSTHLISKPAKLTCSDAENKIFNATSDLKLRVDRYTYKCKYCCISSYSTKFKAHIIDHMQSEHNIYLMQCPDLKCNKRFKDEWKLKRHLLSNRDHEPLSGFKCLIDVMKTHVHVTPQKVGFPCPLCHLDENNNQVVTACLEGINEKKTEYFLYFDSYSELNEHLVNKHTDLDVNSYFICKNCGQVFQNRYKLSCHLFNVHSGKRKSRKKQLKLAQQSSQGLFNKASDPNSYYGPSVDSHIDSVIESVANGMVALETKNMINFQTIQQQQQQMQKITCVGCSKKFKRIRDINSHIRIMHKNWSKVEKEQQDAILEMHIKLIKLNKKNIIKKQISSASLLMSQNENNKNVKICFVCNKIFKELTSTPISSLNKTFIRHMQIQHGLNEKGERLVECPVCEKNFFNRQQMERHMHTHEIWVEIKEKRMNQEQQEQQQNNSVIYLSTYDSSFYLDDLTSNQLLANSNLKSTVKTNEKLETIDYRDKHSILYCHECVECKLYFKSIKVLTKHKHDTHNLKPVYKCANTIECDQEFETVSSFLEHSKLHPQKNIICTRCRIKFNNKNTLRLHMKNVHYNRRLTTSGVTSAGNVAIKKAIKHNQPQTIRNLNSNKLIISSFVPTSSTNLSVQNTISSSNSIIIKPTDLAPSSQESTSTVSNSDDSFCCPTCKKNFTSRNSLHNHLATHNTSELRLFLCNICGHSFKTRKDLSRHASLHDSSKHKTCQECGMSFKTSFHLKRHSLTRHSNLRPFKCNHCDMQFARKDKLKQHEAKHINHPLYQCSQCSKGFYRKEHLKDHEISKHSKQYPFSCEHCNKGFVHAKDLHRHIRVRHLGIAPLTANSSSSPSSSSSSSSTSTTTMNTHLSSHNNNNIGSNNNNGSLSGLIKQKKSKINNLKTANLMPVKQVNNAIALHSSMVTPLTIASAAPTNPSPSINTHNNDNNNNNINNYNNNNNNSNNNTVIASGTPLVQLTSNDFKSKKISSILKSNLISSQFSTPQINTANFENISTNITGNNSKQIIPHLVINQPLQKHILQPQNQQQINTAFISSSFSINNNSDNNNQFNYDQTKFRFIPIEMNNSGLFVLPSNNDNNINNYKAIDVAKNNNSKKSHKKIISQSNISGQQYLKSFKCSTCSKGFFYENHLRKHVLSKHSQTPLYSCSCCNQGFSTRATAKSHVENSHASYACPICNKSFKNKSHCVRHISSTHSSSNSNVLSTLEPKREFKTDAKLIDQSLVNINMLNLIQIDKTTNNKSSVENQSVDLNLKNLTNSIPNSSAHLIIYGKNEVKEKNEIESELTTYSTQPLNAFFTNNSQNQDHNKINSISIVATNKNQPFYSNTINMIALKPHSRYNVTTGNSINSNSATSNSNLNANLTIDNLRFQI